MKWFYELLSLSLGATPIITLLLCLNPLLKKRYSAKWRYTLWITVSIYLLLPFSYIKNFFIFLKLPEVFPSELLPSTSVDVNQLPKMNSVNLNNANDSLVEVLSIIYFIGIIMYLVYVIFSYTEFKRNIFRWSTKISNYEIQTILIDEKKRLNINRNVPLLISKKVSSPMLIGFIRPALVLPSEAYTPKELSMILKHELVHLKRNDIIIKTILTSASLIHWFNPAVHLMVKQAGKDMEQSCDDYVLSGCDIEEKKFYCNIILKIAALNNNVTGPVFSTNIVNGRKNLESRIKGIFDSSKKKRGAITLIVVILFVIISSTIFNVTSAEEAGKIYPKNEFINEQNDVVNENEVKIQTKDNKLEINNKFENSEPKNENKKPEIIENADLENLLVTDIQQDNAKINQKDSIEIQEKNIAENDVSEIVIVDLNQLENQLNESETVE